MIAATEDVSERSRIGLAQLHRYLPFFKNFDDKMNTRFYPIIKLEKVEEEEMRILMENLPEQYSAKLGASALLSSLSSGLPQH